MFRVAVVEPLGPAKIRLNSRFAALLLAAPHDRFPEAAFNEHRLSPYDAVRCRNTGCHSYRCDARKPGACRSFRPAARAGAVSNVVRSCVVSIHRGQWCSLWLHCHSPASRPLASTKLWSFSTGRTSLCTSLAAGQTEAHSRINTQNGFRMGRLRTSLRNAEGLASIRRRIMSQSQPPVSGNTRPQAAVRQESVNRRQSEQSAQFLMPIAKAAPPADHLSKMLFHKRPEFRRPPLSPYRERSLVDRATSLFSWLGRGIFGLLNIVLLLATAAAGPGADLPTSKKGWFALAAIIGGGVLICIVVVRWMHLPVTQQR